MKLFSKNRLLVSLLSSSLSNGFLLAPTYAMDPPEEDKRTVAPIMHGLVQDPDSSDPYLLFCNLLESSNEEDKIRGVAALKEIIQNPSHKNYSEAVQTLFRNGGEKDKRLIAPIIHRLVQDLNTVNRFDLAYDLFYSAHEDDKTIGGEVLRDITQNPSDPNYCWIAGMLLRDDNQENKALGVRILTEIVQDPSHPSYLAAVQELIVTPRELSEATFLNLLPVLSLADLGLVLDEVFWTLLDASSPEVQKQAETVFLKKPLKFMENHMYLGRYREFFKTHGEDKKNLWLSSINEALSSSSMKDENNFNAALLVLMTSDQEQFIDRAKKVFFNLVDTQEESFLLYVELLLQSIKDSDLKEQVLTHLLCVAKKGNILEDDRALIALLNQPNEKIRGEAIVLCQAQLESIDPNRIKGAEDVLCQLGTRLNNIEEGKFLAQRILALVLPAFQLLLLESDSWSEHLPLLRFTMKVGDEEQRLAIFTLLKKGITELEKDDGFAAQGAADCLIDSLGVDHPWSQEIIDLATKLQNIDHPNSPFTIHKQLLEKSREPVKHFLPHFQLPDGRTVTFNFKTLQGRRKSDFIAMPHKVLVKFAEQIVHIAAKDPENFKLYAIDLLIEDPQGAVKEANEVFFQSLLDTEKEEKPSKNVSLTSFKLRHILKSIQELQAQESQEIPSPGLIPSLKRILSLFNNLLSCSTGKENGIDATYRLLTHSPGASEEDLQSERLKEEFHEFGKEEMRCLRETLLSGNGSVVRSLLNPSITNESELKRVQIEEAPHQAKYLGNLLGQGAEIGTLLEGKGISFDQNGGCVSPLLRECSTQQALDTLYRYHTPKTSIAHFHELFKYHGLTGKVDGKNTTAKIISEYFSYQEQGDEKYIVFDNADVPSPIGLTPLGVTELLIRNKILDVIEKE